MNAVRRRCSAFGYNKFQDVEKDKSIPSSMRRGYLPMTCGHRESLLYDRRDDKFLALFGRVCVMRQLLPYPQDLQQGVELSLTI